MTLNNWLKAVVFSASIALVSTPLIHANEPGEEWNKGACKDDAEKLCPGMTPGQGEMRDCLKQHQGELSADCKGNMVMMKDKMKKHREEVQAACKADADQFCKDITPGEGREMACLHAHSDKVSAGCKEAIKRGHPHKMMMGEQMKGSSKSEEHKH